MNITHDDEAQPYCWDFNEYGYCKTCGAMCDSQEPRIVEPFHLNGAWPTNTWFQKRRSVLLQKAAEELKS